MFSFIDSATLKSYLRRFPSVIFFVLLISSVYLCINLLRDGSDRMAITFGAIQLGGDPFEQWYQVASYIFVETGGFFHFIVMLTAIIFIAPPLERVYGSVKFTLLFIVTGMIGGSFLFTLPLDDVVGGASISLLGLVGLQIGLLLRGKSMMNSNHSLFMWLSVFSIVAYTYAFPQFPWISYLSSLISGLVFSVIVQPQSFAQLSKSNPYIAMLQTVFVVGMLFFMLFVPMYLTEPTNHFGDVTQHVKDRLDTVSTFKDEQLDRVSSLFDSSNRASATEEEEPPEENEAEQIDHMVVAAEFLGEGEPDLAIAELKKVKKSSAEYEEAQYQIETINLNLYLEQPMETDYKELQKRTEHYKGSTVHFYGKHVVVCCFLN
ncbi:rhomboid family intramembrane serine protease [Alkalihalobacillus sp. FSL W8-0930]